MLWYQFYSCIFNLVLKNAIMTRLRWLLLLFVEESSSWANLMSDSKSSGSICSSTQTLTSSLTNSCCRCFGMLVRMMDSTGRQSPRRRRMNRAPQMHPITDAVSITYHVSDDNLFHNFLETTQEFSFVCVLLHMSTVFLTQRAVLDWSLSAHRWCRR